jgi:hypothetical protein
MHGQAMIEYIVVLAFSVILLVKPFTLNGNTEAPAITQLSDAIKAYHKSYAYAMNVAAIPECNYSLAYDKSPLAATIALPPALASFNPTVSVDRCLDWSNPQIPPVSFSGVPSLGDISTGIQHVIDQSINGIKDKITNPQGLTNLLNFANPF